MKRVFPIILLIALSVCGLLLLKTGKTTPPTIVPEIAQDSANASNAEIPEEPTPSATHPTPTTDSTDNTGTHQSDSPLAYYRSDTPLSPFSAAHKNPAPNTRAEATWAVRFTDKATGLALAAEWNAEMVRHFDSDPQLMQLRFPGSEKEPEAGRVAALLADTQAVLAYEQDYAVRLSLRYSNTPPSEIADPLFSSQWHLSNTGQANGTPYEDANLIPAWNLGYTGAGITIGIIDTGLDTDHPDYALNYRSDIDYDFIDDDTDPNPSSSDETHGTSVAGVAAALANDTCGVGTAYNADLLGLRLINTDVSVSSTSTASALTWHPEVVDIYNNSWGHDISEGAYMSGPGATSYAAIVEGITDGRNGLGAIYVWAAGNGLEEQSNVNYDGWANNRYTIAVGAVGDYGSQSSYSEPGAPMLVCAPSNGNSQGITTTDIAGSDGATSTDCRSDFGGTSSASPLVSGIVALMLEANPQLDWRDVQEILATTAVKVDADDSDWTQNGADYWVNHKYGFGRVDAAAAVQLARDWTSLPNEISISSGLLSPHLSIPDTASGSAITQFLVGQSIRVSHVAVNLYLDGSQGTTNWGQISVVLISPDGTQSILAEPHTDAEEDYTSWEYYSVRHLGEDSAGTWTLKVVDHQTGTQHTLDRWRLTLYGSPQNAILNQRPDVNDETFTLTSSPATLEVLANDSDPDGDPLQIISLYQSEHADCSIQEDGTLLYTPVGTTGTDRIGYTVSDGKGGVGQAFVSIINPVPIAHDDYVATQINSPVEVPVLDNDVDSDGDTLRITQITTPAHGSTSIVEGSIIRYTPANDFFGNDTFQYTITDDEDGSSSATVHIAVPNHGDFAMFFDGDDDYLTAGTDSSLNTTGAFALESWIKPTGWGEAATGYGRILDKNSIVIYLHSYGFSVTNDNNQEVSYNTNSLLTSLTWSDGSQTVYNTPANSITLNKWQHIAISYDGNGSVDMYIDGTRQILSRLTVEPFAPPAPPLASHATDPFMVGEAPSSERAFQGAMDEYRFYNRSLTSSEVQSRYQSHKDANTNGLLLEWRFTDGVGDTVSDATSAQRDATAMNHPRWIKGIIGTNDSPNGVDDHYTIDGSMSVLLDVLANDSDPDNDFLELFSLDNPSIGSAQIVGSQIRYTPASNEAGKLSFTYMLGDGQNQGGTATISIEIDPGSTYASWAEENLPGQDSATDADPDGDGLINFYEYAFGTDPTDPYSQTLDFEISRSDEGTHITFSLPRRFSDVEFIPQISHDLKNWVDAELNSNFRWANIIEHEDGTETWEMVYFDSIGFPSFLRLKAASPSF